MSVNKYHFSLEKRLTSSAGKGETWHEKQEVMESEVIVQAEKDGKVKNGLKTNRLKTKILELLLFIKLKLAQYFPD